jgi:hypothetical protein
MPNVKTMLHPTLRSCVLAAALLALSVSWPNAAGLAQQPAGTPAGKPAPITLNPDWLQIPADTASTGKTPDLKQPAEPSTKIAVPDTIKLGQSELQFNAGRRNALAVPPNDDDSSAPSALRTDPLLQKSLPNRPNYFGLQLTTPLH